jgi:hypothetical protein
MRLRVLVGLGSVFRFVSKAVSSVLSLIASPSPSTCCSSGLRLVAIWVDLVRAQADTRRAWQFCPPVLQSLTLVSFLSPFSSFCCAASSATFCPTRSSTSPCKPLFDFNFRGSVPTVSRLCLAMCLLLLLPPRVATPLLSCLSYYRFCCSPAPPLLWCCD